MNRDVAILIVILAFIGVMLDQILGIEQTVVYTTIGFAGGILAEKLSD